MFSFTPSDSDDEASPLLAAAAGPSVVAAPALVAAAASEGARTKTPRTLTSRRRTALFVFLFFGLVLFCAAPWLRGDSNAPVEAPTTPPVEARPPRNVSFSRRAIHVDGSPQLLTTATIHYPRSDPSVWPSLLHRIRLAGNNAIDTYVFWNLHEQKEGEYDFENGIANLPLFLKLAQEADLYVVLRIGPYVCAEWNFGGFPVWLINKPGMELRTFNQPFMAAMSRFIEKTLEVVHEQLAPQGGPIILLQIENEYGNIANDMGPPGYKYIQWAGEYAKSLNVGVPWIMCRQDNVATVINAENGFYADAWIEGHHNRFPDQPALVTELWTGWFQKFGQPKFTRYAEDLAFASARFIAKGGTYVGYYMWHGGTNFGKWGSDFKTTSYDYDAPLNEYGFPNNPKHQLLADLHHTLHAHSALLLANEPTRVVLGKHAEAHVYGNMESHALVFLSNDDSGVDVAVEFGGKRVVIPRWTVLIYRQSPVDGFTFLYSTSSPKPVLSLPMPESRSENLSTSLGKLTNVGDLDGSSSAVQRLVELSALRSNPSTTDLHILRPSTISHIFEPIGIYDPATAVTATSPLEQIRASVDASDYMWYVREVVTKGDVKAVQFESVEDVASVFWDGEKVHEGLIVGAGGVGVGVKREVVVDLEEGVKKGGGRRGGHDKKKAPPPPPPKKGGEEETTHELAVLVSVAGIWNYGADMGDVRKGILGKVVVDKQDVTKGMWVHQVGLKGEHLKYTLGSKSENLIWQPFVTPSLTPINTPLVWYLLKFSKPDLMALHAQAQATQLLANQYTASHLSTAEPITTFVLNLSTMTRGLAFVNGHAVGRYWNLAATCPKAGLPCRYPDSAVDGGETCAEGCGYASQGWYHVPVAWVVEGEWDDVEVVLVEESGGDPGGVGVGVVSG
ncbi:hypothetical protein HDU98_003585, partial [Podochytrium sp. JEL0797]